MIIEQESLAKHTTFQMGGTARIMYMPESREELLELLKLHPEAGKYVIGGGSNLLINDEKTFDQVLLLKKCCTEWEDHGQGRFYCGASIRLQKLIRLINEAGYGGIEYLYSVPGLTGGAVFMNAGRGKKYNKSISDFIVAVDVLIDGEIKRYSREECGFDYRTSVFQHMPGVIIIGVEFLFPSMTQEETSAAIQERIELCKRVQDMSEPNFGTVFRTSNDRLLSLAVRLHPGKKEGCHYSRKSINWMLRGKKGSFKEAISLIRSVEKLHRLSGKKCVPEVIIWE